ncbi:GerAB/ArcD/ProY family transporter [Gottfriedia sp. NPDC057991]|uniref:GerAB/ArcD/ProY family transporter n=1 Tax=Gottfriedia sp. NPDC057991 TaxID=3346298 RepID=UPI0036D8F895
MTRHFYYTVLLTMMLNIIINVPMILIGERFNGSIISMVLSVLIGGIFIYLFTIGISKFPNKGLPEIFNNRLPKLVKNIYLAFLGVMWLAAGAFVLISFTYITVLYLNTELNMGYVLAFFLVIVIYGANCYTKSILNVIEIMVLVATPVVFFIVYKALASNYFYFVHIKRILHYFWQMPNYSSISAATYFFTGYINLAIINRYLETKKVVKFLWILPLIGFVVISFTFFVPIAFLGVKGINDVVFPWVFITDSLRMEYGFIERVLYLMLYIFLLLSLLFSILTWHVGLKLFEGMFFYYNLKPAKKRKFYGYMIFLFFGAVTMTLQTFTNERELFDLIKIWQNIRFPAEGMLVVSIFFLSRRQRA